jgi:hypothetical protein
MAAPMSPNFQLSTFNYGLPRGGFPAKKFFTTPATFPRLPGWPPATAG